MFINVAEEMRKARVEGYALGAFNTSNLEVTKAICAAASELGFPFIIQTTPSAVKYADLNQIFNIVKTEIENKSVLGAIHIDHAKEFEIVKDCVDIGYRSVMIDGSKLSFEENVALTKKVVDYAHLKNVSVEAEIGAIGTEEGGGISSAGVLSNPEETAKFVQLTGIDTVAVSIGNEHGAPSGERINIELLKTIASMIEIPLVLHGASGLSDDDVRMAISNGVSKINIDTNIRKAFLEGWREFPEDTKDYRDVMKVAMANISDVVKEKMLLFRNGK